MSLFAGEEHAALVDCIELAPDGVVIVDRAGTICAANARVEALLGYSPASLVGQPVEVLVPAGLRAGHRELRDAYLREPVLRMMGATTRPISGQHADGRIVPLDIMLRPFASDDGRVLCAIRDVTEFRALEAQLREALEQLETQNAELAELNEKKNRFLGIAAHDLRNPLAAIKGYAELLAEGEEGALTGPQIEVLERVQRSCKHMLSMIDSLLDISAIEAGSLVLDRRPTDLDRLVQEALGVQRHVADAKSIAIKLPAPGDVPDVWLDPGRFEQVVHNLVGNAVKYSPPGSRIDVTVRCDADCAYVDVSDEGPGIPPLDHEQIFEPFRRSSPTPTAGETSTGLGLAIARRIVDGHGGQIALRSAIGKGSTFTVSLPLGEPSAPGAA